MPDPIVFYDIPSTVRGSAFSGNTWKTRFTLNYKGLEYKTIWVEYPDIARTCQEVGANPTGVWPDGSPMYTFPVIHDPSTGKTLADSAPIARYLDATYPETPRVVPERTEAFHEAVQSAMDSVFAPHIFHLIMPTVYERLNDASKAHFKEAREKVVGGKIEEWSPRGSAIREQQWEILEKSFGKIAQWLGADGKERRFFMGETVSYADFILGARLVWMKRILGEESEEWQRVEQWHSGRWARLLDTLEGFST